MKQKKFEQKYSSLCGYYIKLINDQEKALQEIKEKQKIVEFKINQEKIMQEIKEKQKKESERVRSKQKTSVTKNEKDELIQFCENEGFANTDKGLTRCSDHVQSLLTQAENSDSTNNDEVKAIEA